MVEDSVVHLLNDFVMLVREVHIWRTPLSVIGV